MPTFLVAQIAIGLSYLAYYNSREKFRLDLFEKRYESYQNCLSVCSAILQHGDIPDAIKFVEERKKFESSVNKSFRGEGYSLSYFLFGPEIKKLYEELNLMYSHLSTYSNNTLSELSHEERIKQNLQKHEHVSKTWEIVKNLPHTFSKYFDMSEYVKR